MQIKDIISSGLLELYAAGLASQEEAVNILQWVQQYPEVAAELAEIEAAMSLYSSAYILEPDPSVKEKVFARINEEERAKIVPIMNEREEEKVKVIHVSSFWRNAAVASIVLLLGSAALNMFLYNKNGNINDELQQNRELVNNLEKKNREMDNYVDKVSSKYSTPVSLAGLKVQDASAKVFWMKNTGDVYVDPSNLPELPKGKQYELWAIIDGKPVNAGIIVTTKKGDTYNIQQMKSFGAVQVQAFAVSLEPESVKPAETPTEVYAMGKM